MPYKKKNNISVYWQKRLGGEGDTSCIYVKNRDGNVVYIMVGKILALKRKYFLKYYNSTLKIHSGIGSLFLLVMLSGRSSH